MKGYWVAVKKMGHSGAKVAPFLGVRLLSTGGVFGGVTRGKRLCLSCFRTDVHFSPREPLSFKTYCEGTNGGA